MNKVIIPGKPKQYFKEEAKIKLNPEKYVVFLKEKGKGG